VVAWALTITDLDPLRWGLLFERFLNPERVSMPDFDIDFCQDRREEVIRYVQATYGRDHVAQIITFGKLQARAALRDVGRVLQMPYPQVDRICKLVPNNPASPVTLSQAISGEPQLLAMRREDPAVARLMEIALGIEGLYRHASTHAAGLVIGDRPLEELVPLYRDPRSDIPVTQFSMKYVELAGLVKFDFLGLKTLTVLAKACRLIEAGGGTIDLDKIPIDDPLTYEMLGRAETVGVFQLESSGMRDALRKLKSDRFEDIIAVVALYRPGPMDNIPSYIKRKHGEEPIDYLHPSLEGILKETYGIMIYQEQVMQIAQELAGYSLGGADLLRRAMGKKIQSEMDAQRQTFIEGAVAREVPKAQAAAIFEQVNKFAGYGFNKSHAAAYALVAYQTAYLKANHPVAFMAALMTYDMGNTDKLNVFRQELQRMEVALLPPDINRSEVEFSVEAEGEGGPAIRYALAAIKNVGAGAMAAVVAAREAGGPFTSMADFVSRLESRQVNKRQIEMLACAGAFDGLNANRAQLHQAAEIIVRHAAAAAQERDSAQENLFGGDAAAMQVELPLPQVEDWPAMERLRHEFAAIGFYLSAHPLDAYQASMEKLGVITYRSLVARAAGGRCKLGGIVIGKRELNSRKGSRMAFVQCTDTSGVFEVTAFSEILSRARELLDSSDPLLFTLSVEWQAGNEEPRLTLQDIEPMEKVAARSTAGLRLFLEQTASLESVKRLLERDEPGRGRVYLVLDLDEDQEIELELPVRHRLSAPTRQALKAIPGVMVQDL
jgi:DNA polymerase-3 subunit alpha